ncbi:aldo/keto reductase [Larkinella punicea]|uniref:Aldo/keto reductase n=1 Tax=Larkinella punicea TaxID=2315727 RepID=A0A368JU21_9BACT|nr:aldo/keto reductase [Larkinella punicea]RCR71170.1 aldo/keto reductase [Larkinella punicea]
MRKRELGKTGIAVSELAFGGVEIGLPYGIGVKSAADMLSEDESIRLLHEATESGVNFFDTARLYGASEAIMGKAFRDRREQVVIGTKCRQLRDGNGELPNGSDLKKLIKTSLLESLTALQTDYVDIFMLHQADLGILENDEIPQIFADLRAEGAIRSTGVSTYTVEETQKAIETGVWDVIQLPFNLMDQRQAQAFAQAAEKGVGIVVRSVLMKGLLTSKGHQLHPALADVENHLRRFDDLVATGFPDLSTLAVRFVATFPEVSSLLVGIDKPAYLHQSLAAVNGAHLDAETLARAKDLAYPDPTFLNLPHWDRMGWLN